MSELIHLVYASRATRPYSDDDLIRLLNKARSNNLALNVSGMLLYVEGSFFQVLEGEPDTLHRLYERISTDTGHDKIVKIIEEPIEDRAFGEWQMGFFGATRKQLAEIEGLSVFFTHKAAMTEIGTSRATVLLNAFVEGRYRLS
ncbi:MAG: BLUF domain-containing protein [Gammaproteobacteria bacterium]|nr:BLUF domain-containing protein [Gammaproteobacteria bacterium]